MGDFGPTVLQISEARPSLPGTQGDHLDLSRAGIPQLTRKRLNRATRGENIVDYQNRLTRDFRGQRNPKSKTIRVATPLLGGSAHLRQRPSGSHGTALRHQRHT